ncbi:MAG: aldose 1-epimerase family protein [Liquorilactobacillus ghanensis]|uniref:aldose 1-epimerase family protein n=1 Tax=Liquorilactobacillus ghanensis TaxID=399370 RepID=UPI0039EB93D7
MITIENQYFQAVIDAHGAQLTHLYHKAAGFDYLWNNPAWNKHAPVLFPAIGRSNLDQYQLNSHTYSMPQHGFIADQDFQIVAQTKHAVSLRAQATAATRKMFPFDFALELTFTLTSLGLSLTFTVTNNSQETMPFSLGSHPAFNVPLISGADFTDYYLEFSGDFELPLENFEIVKTPAPYRTGKTETFARSQKIALNHDLFAKGLRIIANSQIKQVKLASATTNHQVIVNLGDFANVCLWTKEDKELPFLCIEPFNGLPDVLGEPVDWQKKQANLQLAANKTQLFQYELLLK